MKGLREFFKRKAATGQYWRVGVLYESLRLVIAAHGDNCDVCRDARKTIEAVDKSLGRSR